MIKLQKTEELFRRMNVALENSEENLKTIDEYHKVLKESIQKERPVDYVDGITARIETLSRHLTKNIRTAETLYKTLFGDSDELVNQRSNKFDPESGSRCTGTQFDSTNQESENSRHEEVKIVG